MAPKIPDFYDPPTVGAPLPSSSPPIEISTPTIGKAADIGVTILGGAPTIPETTLKEIHVTPDELKNEVLAALDKIDPSRRGEIANKAR